MFPNDKMRRCPGRDGGWREKTTADIGAIVAPSERAKGQPGSREAVPALMVSSDALKYLGRRPEAKPFIGVVRYELWAHRGHLLPW
jgi:hypothetical protein